MGKKLLIIISKILGVIAILFAFKIAFYAQGKPAYQPKFTESVYSLLLIGFSLFYLNRLSEFIKHYNISKIKLSPIEFELKSVENILGVADDDDLRQKKGLLKMVENAFEDIDRKLQAMVSAINEVPEVLSEKQMALVYLKYDSVRPELVSAFFQLRVKRLDLLVDGKKLKNSEIIKIVALCYQIADDLDNSICGSENEY